ncbi:DUF4113 domain-containing protein [Methylobacterium sp. WL19]|nr:DUF4113 domain-containing protein [Methylobacterium sp. WL19]
MDPDAVDTQRTYSTSFDMRSPRYTTRIADIRVVGVA